MAMSAVEIVVGIIAFPFIMVFMMIFMVIWLIMTVTCIGPLAQYCYNRRDKNTLDRDRIVRDNESCSILEVPGDIHSCSVGDPYKMFVIFSRPANPNGHPPVCIPNGLGATAVIISQMQERLVSLGFTVLNFDRLGVGFSDENKSRKPPTAMDMVREMDFVMSSVLPADTKWILLGPSMGSIVAQCYISVHPEKVLGFLNMDGLPYPFMKYNSMFLWAGFIYKMYAAIIWTGILRPFIGPALKKQEEVFRSTTFDLKVVVAQMNQAKFFGNVGLEMVSMMACCRMAEEAWGSCSSLDLSPPDYEAMVRSKPTASIDFDEKTGEPLATSLRSPSEVGPDWVEPARTEEALRRIKSQSLLSAEAGAVHSAPEGGKTGEDSRGLLEPLSGASALTDHSSPGSSVLARRWSQLVVRIMSARNHDFGNPMANSFYGQSLRDDAAAEHSLHMLLAKNGERTVYPKISHATMFAKTAEITRNIQEIADALMKDQR